MGKNEWDDEGFSLEDYFKEEYKEDYEEEYKEEYKEEEYKEEECKEEEYKEERYGAESEYYRSEREKKVGEEDDVEEIEELESKVDRWLNKVLDYFESKQFTALQWSVAVGILTVIWGLMFMMSSAGKNVQKNAEYQEENSPSYLAKEVAPEQYIEFEEEEYDKELKELDDTQYLEENKKSYEAQKEALGELPEGYVAIIDDSGVLSYLSPEEHEEFIYSEEGMSDLGGDEEIEVDLPIDIVPADELVWENISYGDLNQLSKEDVYQTRGEYLYFAQRVIAFHFPNQVLDSDIDTNSFVLTVYENPNASFDLPDDFEERMHFAFDHSGYGSEYGGQLEIEYKEGSIN